MKITNIINNIKAYKTGKDFRRTKNGNSNAHHNIVYTTQEIPSGSIKANYLTSCFNEYEKISQIPIRDRKTNTIITADVYGNKNKSNPSFQIRIDGKIAGYMKMDCTTELPRGIKLSCGVKDEIVPCISDLRSLSGGEYSGIGTALVKEAVKVSKNIGAKGRLWLYSMEGYEKNQSAYRQGENPIPFYHKLGFRVYDEFLDNLIKDCIESKDTEDLPQMCTMFLSAEDADKLISK